MAMNYMARNLLDDLIEETESELFVKNGQIKFRFFSKKSDFMNLGSFQF